MSTVKKMFKICKCIRAQIIFHDIDLLLKNSNKSIHIHKFQDDRTICDIFYKK
jgi:hypothetical protein